jgi:CAAX protease family protein
MELDYESKPQSPPPPIWGFDRDELAYLVPMASFMVFVWLGTLSNSIYPWAYVARTILVAGLLWKCRKHYTPIQWNYWWLGAFMGVVGIIQWIGMDTVLQTTAPSWFALNPEKAFNPAEYFHHPVSRWSWIAVRLIGSSLVVPFMEELFWRDYLWRRLVAPVDFKLATIGEWDKVAYFGVAAAFCVVHPQWLTAIGWGLLIGGLLLYTRSLGACIIMHAVTNLLLGLYVLQTKEWAWW